jgi:hypothetical protein
MLPYTYQKNNMLGLLGDVTDLVSGEEKGGEFWGPGDTGKMGSETIFS